MLTAAGRSPGLSTAHNTASLMLRLLQRIEINMIQLRRFVLFLGSRGLISGCAAEPDILLLNQSQ